MHECCSTSSQQWQKTQLPKQSPASTFVTGRAVKDVLAQLNTGVLAGPCAWEQPLPQPGATGWNFSAQEAPGTQTAWIWLSYVSKIFILRLSELPFRLESPIPIHQHPYPPKSIENSDFKFSQNNTISPLPPGQTGSFHLKLPQRSKKEIWPLHFSFLHIDLNTHNQRQQQTSKSIDSNRTRGVT